MRSKRASTKALLAFIVTLLLAGVFCVTAFAADREEYCGNRYGRIIPTDANLDAQVFDYYFTGDSAPIHFMRMSTGEAGACYAVEIYSDASYTNLIKYLSREYSTTAGHSPVAINLPFDDLKSGTYYGRCYTYVTRSDGTIYDLDSYQYFNIHIDRLSNKTVMLSWAANTDSGIDVVWTPIATATEYHVYRRVNGEAEWNYVATVGEGSYNYTDTDVVNGWSYLYTVRCSDGGYSSGYDNNGVYAVRLSTPVLNYVAQASPQGYAGVCWNPVDGADGYYVYRKGGSLSNYEWRLLADVQGGYSNYYIDTTSTSSSWCYNYTVVAYKDGSTSSYNPVGVEYSYMLAPVLTNITNDNYGVYLDWYDGNRNSLGYNVYRKTWNGEWERLATVTDKWFVDTTAVSGGDYVYTVTALCATNESAYSDDGIAIRYLSTPYLNDVYFDEYNTAVVSWGYVNGAEKYQVYRKLSYEQNWVLLGETYDTCYYDSITKYSGETYTYTVVALGGNSGSNYDRVGKTGCFLEAPAVNVNNVSVWGTPGVQVNWNYVNGAAYYDVYRCDYGVYNWTCIAGGVTENSFVDYTAPVYGGYSYAIVALNDYARSRYNEASLVVLPAPKLEYCSVGNEGGVHLGWTALNDGAIYHIYRKTVDGAWEEIGTSTTNYFADWSQEAVNQYYTYTVVAELYGYYSGFDGIGISNFTEMRNLNGVFVDGEVPYIAINWEYDGFAQWYELTKSVNGETVSLGVFAGDSGITQYVDTEIAIGNAYTYTITAVCEGRFQKTNTVTVKYPLPPVPAAPLGGANGYVNNGVACVDIVWGFVDYAEVYTIYRRTDSSDWIALGTVAASDLVNGLIYTDTTAEFDVNYYYTVVGYADNRESYYDTVGVQAIVLKPIDHPYGVAVREDILNTQTVAIVGWDEVYRAEYYNVYRKDNNSDWVLLGTVSDGNCWFVDYSVVQGIKYTYTVSAGANGRGEAINPVGATYRWNVNASDFVAADYTGLFEYLGTWYYCENGNINWNCDTLVQYNDRWFYAYGGEVNWGYTGLVYYNNAWFYVENGEVNFSATTLCFYNGSWYYVENGAVNFNATTLVYFEGAWYYVENGAVNFAATTLCFYNDAWYYVENGVVNFNATTLIYYNNDWYYVENGAVNFGATTLVLYNNIWYYVENGKINWECNTLVNYDNGWFYVYGGEVCWWYTGLAFYNNEWYYVENGAVNFDVTTLVFYNDVWYYVENGKINWECNTLINYNDYWYYVYGGTVNWDYTGLVCYNNEWYYVEYGFISFATSTLVEYNGNWYYVRDSYLDWTCSTVVPYNGNNYYVYNGEVAFWFTGEVTINGILYRIVNGVVEGMPFDINPVY